MVRDPTGRSGGREQRDLVWLRIYSEHRLFDHLVAAQAGRCIGLLPTLSRREVHHFLTAPPQVAMSHRALWYAVARVHTDDVALAVSISRTTLDRCPVTNFWKDVVRFLARNPTLVSEMNIIEYVALAVFFTPDLSLVGRTLTCLRERLQEWRTLGEYAFYIRARWPGSVLPDRRYEYAGAVWLVRQIRSGADLTHEGKIMRHCVRTYLQACMQGVLLHLVDHVRGRWLIDPCGHVRVQRQRDRAVPRLCQFNAGSGGADDCKGVGY